MVIGCSGLETAEEVIKRSRKCAESQKFSSFFFFSFSLHGGAAPEQASRQIHGFESAAEKFLLKNGRERVLDERNDRQPVAT